MTSTPARSARAHSVWSFIAPMTRAPFQRAIITAALPTPPAAPVTRIVSPVEMPPDSVNADPAVT